MENEREIEHFGFSAEHISIERKYFIKKILNLALDHVLSKIDCTKETSAILTQQKDGIVKDIISDKSINRSIQMVEKMDKKYFSVPDHVLLPPYFDHAKQYTEWDEKDIDDQIERYRKTFLENSLMLASLKLENSQYKSLVPFVEDELKVHRQLEDSFKHFNMNEIKELVDKTLSLGK
ncbi:mis12 [Musca autumnalis]|uniref:mis12 n=1 Tax=Musca autumnalis TaxID=221902 RepID=UPI003CECF6BD